MEIALVNRSRMIKDPHHTLGAIADAGTKYLALVAAVWERTPWTVQYYAKAADAPKTSILATVRSHPKQDGIGGYHDEVGGLPMIDIFAGPSLDNGGTLLVGDDAVSVTAMHEFGETFLDPTVNAWRQSADGSLKALELCDAVQGPSFALQTEHGVEVACANFVYPGYFDIAGHGQLDQLMLLRQPFGRLQTGYDITMTGGSITQEFGDEVKPWMVLLKSRPDSRIARVTRRTPGHRHNYKHHGHVWWRGGENAPDAPYKATPVPDED